MCDSGLFHYLMCDGRTLIEAPKTSLLSCLGCLLALQLPLARAVKTSQVKVPGQSREVQRSMPAPEAAEQGDLRGRSRGASAVHSVTGPESYTMFLLLVRAGCFPRRCRPNMSGRGRQRQASSDMLSWIVRRRRDNHGYRLRIYVAQGIAAAILSRRRAVAVLIEVLRLSLCRDHFPYISMAVKLCGCRRRVWAHRFEERQARRA